LSVVEMPMYNNLEVPVSDQSGNNIIWTPGSLFSQKVPSSSTTPCTLGQIAWNDSSAFICIAPNLWRKTLLTEF
jgi:hypothetical protein